MPSFSVANAKPTRKYNVVKIVDTVKENWVVQLKLQKDNRLVPNVVILLLYTLRHIALIKFDFINWE